MSSLAHSLACAMVLLSMGTPSAAEPRGPVVAEDVHDGPLASSAWGRAYLDRGRVVVVWPGASAPAVLQGLPNASPALDLRAAFLSPRRLLVTSADGRRWIAVEGRTTVTTGSSASDETQDVFERERTSEHLDMTPRAGPRLEPWNPARPLHRDEPHRAAPPDTTALTVTTIRGRAPRVSPWRARWRDMGLSLSLWLQTRTLTRAHHRTRPYLHLHQREVAAGVSLRGRWRPLDPIFRR